MKDDGEEDLAPEPEREDLLGLSIAPLTEELRERFNIGKSVEGVVITEVKPNSPAAQKDVKPGEVIVEVTQEKVKQPQDVKTRVLAVKKSGRNRCCFCCPTPRASFASSPCRRARPS